MVALLEVRNLVKQYGQLRAVDSLSFDVQPGEAFGLLGPNGAGKSTTMMMICGLLEPDGGEVRLNGQLLDRKIPASRSGMGVVPQDLAIYPDLTARENLKFFGSLYQLSGKILDTKVNDALEQVGLPGRADDLAETFSGGMKRRLNFAAAILHSPVLLILDEPTVGVDPQSRAHLVECIRTLQRNGTAIIYASHYMEEVQAICSRAAIVDHGRLLACDEIPELLKQIPLELEIRTTSGSLPENIGIQSVVSRVVEGDEMILRISSSTLADEATLNNETTQLLSLLAANSVCVRSIRTHEPNLERLFLKLTGNRLRD